MKILFLIIPVIFLSLIFTGCGKDEHKGHTDNKTIYYCPMHPEVTSDKPSVCPICNMDLVPRSDDSDSDLAKMETGLKMSDSKLMIANVRTVKAVKHRIEFRIQAPGKLDYPEEAKKIIAAKSGGRVEQLFVSNTGIYVKAGAPLYELYSPEMIKTANDYLTLINNSGLSSDPKLLEGSKTRLLNLGLAAQQIEEIARTKEIRNTYRILSPYSGFITSKKIVEGAYYNEGSVLYEIVDNSRLWNKMELFEKDLRFIKPGTKILSEIESVTGGMVNSRINFISIDVDPSSRTVQVRSDVPNSGGRLKPNMFTRNTVLVDLGEAVAVPSSAVLKTGKGDYIWLKRENNKFEKISVRAGVEFNGFVQILSGIKLGDEVVEGGNYLLDSESELTNGKQNPAHEAGHTSHPASGEKVEMNVEGKAFNQFCPVLGDEISDRVAKVRYKGKIIGFCCRGCDQKFAADPELYMQNLSGDGKKFVGKKEN